MLNVKGYLLLLFIQFTTTATGQTSGNSNAQGSVTTSKQYFFSKTLLNQKDAIAECKKSKSELVSILTEEEHNTLEEVMLKQGLTGLYWISGSKASESDPWMWLNNVPMNKSYWNCGEPNNAKKNEFCMESFTRKGKYEYVWNDIPCSEKRKFICEKPDLKISGKAEKSTSEGIFKITKRY